MGGSLERGWRREEASALQSTYYVSSTVLEALLLWPSLISEAKLLSPGQKQVGDWRIQVSLAILCNSQKALFGQH